MTDYSKYIQSTSTHYISNSGSDENGHISGGKAGDQTGNEWRLRSWYSRPWTCVLRHPDPAVRMMIAQKGIDAALNDHIGYDQTNRRSYWKQLELNGYNPAAIKTDCESDCTAGVTANCKATGKVLKIHALADLDPDIYSGNMRKRFKAAGFEVLTDAKYLTSPHYLLPGDVLLYDGHHAATNVTKGKYAKETATVKPTEPADYALGDRTLYNGCVGSDVRELQNRLILLGYSCGSYGADGEFGDATELAVRAMQKDAGHIAIDGIVGAETLRALNDMETLQPDVERGVKIIGGNCWARTAPGTASTKLGVCHEGEIYGFGGVVHTSGWLLIDYKGSNAWVSPRYARVVD